MSTVDSRSSVDVSKPLPSGTVRWLIREILERHEEVAYSDHAYDRLDDHDMSTVDVTNVLRCCHRIDAGEPHIRTGKWTYRVHTEMFCVVVSFRSVAAVRIVTVWRK